SCASPRGPRGRAGSGNEGPCSHQARAREDHSREVGAPAIPGVWGGYGRRVREGGWSLMLGRGGSPRSGAGYRPARGEKQAQFTSTRVPVAPRRSWVAFPNSPLTPNPSPPRGEGRGTQPPPLTDARWEG